ncbi:MAG: cadherin repeat domain-containing protein [Candidatus Puniceispirillales bacterium]
MLSPLTFLSHSRFCLYMFIAICMINIATQVAMAGFGHTRSYGFGSANTPSGQTTAPTGTPPQNSPDNTAPIFTNPPARLDITSQSTGNVLTITAQDAVTSQVSYQLEGAGASHFSIHSSTGAITLSSPISVQLSPLTLIVVASDQAGNATRQNIIINIMPATPQQPLTFATLQGADTQEQQSLQLPAVNGGSGQGPISYNSITLSICSVDGNGLATALNTGLCQINARKAGSGDYAAVNTTTPYQFTVTQGPYAFNGQTYSRCSASVRPCNAVSGQVMATKAFVERGECDAVIHRNGSNCPSFIQNCGLNNRIWATYMVVREGTWYWRLSPPTSIANKPVSSWRTHNWRSYMSNDRPINQTAQFPDDTYDNHGTHINLCMRP